MENNIQQIEILNELRLQYEQEAQLLRQRRKLFRRWWSKPRIRWNYISGYGGFASAYRYFKFNDGEEFKEFTRMTPDQFNYIFDLVKLQLQKRSRRVPLPPEVRLAIVLK